MRYVLLLKQRMKNTFWSKIACVLWKKFLFLYSLLLLCEPVDILFFFSSLNRFKRGNWKYENTFNFYCNFYFHIKCVNVLKCIYDMHFIHMHTLYIFYNKNNNNMQVGLTFYSHTHILIESARSLIFIGCVIILFGIFQFVSVQLKVNVRHNSELFFQVKLPRFFILFSARRIWTHVILVSRIDYCNYFQVTKPQCIVREMSLTV